MLEVVPKDRFGWRPHEKSMTLGELAGHLAEMPVWVRLYLSEGMDLDNLPDREPFLPTTRESLLKTFDENVALFLSTLATIDDEFLEATWTMRSGERVLHEAPRQEPAEDPDPPRDPPPRAAHGLPAPARGPAAGDLRPERRHSGLGLPRAPGG